MSEDEAPSGENADQEPEVEPDPVQPDNGSPLPAEIVREVLDHFENSEDTSTAVATAVRVAMQYQYHGPLPPPEMLARYDETVPGMGKTLLEVFKSQVDHRHEIEKKVITGNVRAQTIGSIAGGLTLLSSFGFAAFAVAQDAAGIGIGAIITAVGGVAAVFYKARSDQDKAIEEHRAEEPPEPAYSEES